MAAEVHKFSVTVAAGTPINAPSLTSMTFPPRIVREIEILVPPGPRGNVGFQIAQAGAQVFPSEPGEFFITDDEQIAWPVEGANTSGAWQLRAYNTGTFPHTLEVRFLVDLPGHTAGAALPEALDPASLGPSAVSEPVLEFPIPADVTPPPEAQLPLPEVPPAPQLPGAPGAPAASLPAPQPLPAPPALPAAALPPDLQGQGGTLPPPALLAGPLPNPDLGLSAGTPTPTTAALVAEPNPNLGLTAGTPTPTTAPTDSGTRLFI